MDTELLCDACVQERENGQFIAAAGVCRECFEAALTNVSLQEGIRVQQGVRGKPEIRTRSEPFDLRLQKSILPREVGVVIDVAPFVQEGRSTWLLLGEDGRISRLDAAGGEWKRLADASVRAEPDHEPYGDRLLKAHLHAAPGGEFAAIVHDYGRYGQIIDLRSGEVTCALDNGNDDSETVPFSFAFAQVRGRVVAIHRTDSNRLDISDPATGELLTARTPTRWQEGEERPEHDLDYYHGALYLSPGHVWLADDGWMWHPFGAPTAWNLERWLGENVWESEDGPSLKQLCGRENYWDHAMAWLDDARIAISGIGDCSSDMIDGARIFDVTSLENDPAKCRGTVRWARELTQFAGPAGTFFSDGRWLFSSDASGLSRWDVADGARTGHCAGFRPMYHHRGSHELVQLVDGALVRWKVSNLDSK